ncbi:prolyl oligopeptidase family serine peptidase [Henriciella sp.]|uniref:prolyl oligopeptidase family serine peptidase n=1 Tax=Henriciella sp. TaxID=1968823 RepID=UPI002602BA2E|nr:prolyl oligopeptidase family serine peptidase [Henriciella sp.]
MRHARLIGAGAAALLVAMPALAQDASAQDDSKQDSNRFTAERVFDLEYATSPRVSPDGSKIVYVRHSMDIRTDQDRGDLWIIDVESGEQRPLVVGGMSASNPRWSPDGEKLIYSTTKDEKPELRLLYLDSGDSFSLAQFEEGPSGASWSPDGSMIAFSKFVPGETPSFAEAPEKPEGAEWNEPVKVFDDLTFRFDGQGYLEEGVEQVFVLSTDGGSPRQLTSGEADMSNPVWLDEDTLLVTGNKADDRHIDRIESEIYTLELSDMSMKALTDRDGPDHSPVVSPDGQTIAFRGHDDNVLSYEQSNLYLMDADGTNVRELAASFDRSMGETMWAPDGESVYVLAENKGNMDVFEVSRTGGVSKALSGLGGTSIGRPYAGAGVSVSKTGEPVFAYTQGSPNKPADIAVAGETVDARELTALNDDILPHLDMATVEEIKVTSSHDGREIEAWVALPPGFEADGSYPMILEIHGGPFSMYGPFFAAEIQRYAAEGYVTVWANPRGSTGYGEEFAQLIDQAYPGNDYDDLMSVVDAIVENNYADPDRLFVTGGSGGGVLTAWIVGKTDRFAAAATIKPVINWFTEALAGDIAPTVWRHWIREDPWENPQAYWELSPISLVGNVVTPTLVMVGEEDWRTPTWEAEQFYTALKLRGIDSALIRVPESPHYIAGRPSRLIAKTDNIMGWFAKYDPAKQDEDSGGKADTAPEKTSSEAANWFKRDRKDERKKTSEESAAGDSPAEDAETPAQQSGQATGGNAATDADEPSGEEADTPEAEDNDEEKPEIESEET